MKQMFSVGPRTVVRPLTEFETLSISLLCSQLPAWVQGVSAITAGSPGSAEGSAQGRGDSPASPWLQLHVKAKGSEIQRDILGSSW